MIYRRNLQKIRKKNQKLFEENEELKTYYTMLNQQIERTRKVHHDIRKHMSVLHTLISNIDESNTIHETFQNLSKQIDAIPPLVYIDHPVLNAIISNRALLCKEHNITFEVEIHNFNHTFMKDSDIVILFSNLLDNAIEECLRLDSSITPRIELKCGKHAGNTILICQNTTNKEHLSKQKLTTQKSDTFTHGLGLNIIEELLDDYQGSINISISDGIFRNTILLPERNSHDNHKRSH